MSDMAEMCHITVIVTVHNSAQYLRECLDSLMAQSFSEFEILCIDGGSTDESGAILTEYCKKCKRIRIVNDSNTSYGHKVNRGIELAKGEYIAVLESDDYYDKDMLLKLWEVVQREHPDIVNGSYEEFMDIDTSRFFSKVNMYEENLYNRLVKWDEECLDYPVIPRYWTGIYRKDFINKQNILFNESEGASFQDMSFRFLTTVYANSTYHISDTVYYYRIDNLTSSMNNPQKAIRIFDEFDYLRSVLEQRDENDIRIWKAFYVWKYGDIYAGLARSTQEIQQMFWERCFAEYEDDYEQIVKLNVENSSVMCGHLRKSACDLKKLFLDIYDSNMRNRNIEATALNRIKCKQAIIFGCGKRGKWLYENCRFIANIVVCFADNSPEKTGNRENGVEVLSPDEAVKRYPKACFLLALKDGREAATSQLRGLGVDSDRVVIFWD